MENKYKKYALLMKALSDETRVKIFHMLSQGELCACNILDEFNITQPTLSYHMKILSDSGLVHSRRDGIWMRYTINKDNLEILKDLFDSIDANLETPKLSDCLGNC
ncbi:MAG: ArsR/SmtB family transcription factor [Peptococcales bacterium]